MEQGPGLRRNSSGALFLRFLRFVASIRRSARYSTGSKGPASAPVQR